MADSTIFPIVAKPGIKRDGTQFDGIDGLRDYLLTKKKEVGVRLFCRRLLGYDAREAQNIEAQDRLITIVRAPGPA